MDCNLETILSYLKSPPSSLSNCKILQKNPPNFGTKNALFEYFCARILKKYYCIWNQYFQICLIAKFSEETEMPNFEIKNGLFEYLWPKMPDLGIAGLELFKKNYCHIWNQYLWICLIAKYGEIIRIPKFGTKNAFYGYFWARIVKQLLSYLKSASPNLSICKILWKNNNT